jgi:hypothetical protein
MASDYLHNHKDFSSLLGILEKEKGIQAQLIEKDYWIMHVLYSLKKQGFDFELKGGTSLSKGYGIIDRFSEDIDIHIKPPVHLGVNENPKNQKSKSVLSRKAFYDWLSTEIKIDGVVSVHRDRAFDDQDSYRSGGIRLLYESRTATTSGIKEGILLEAGFDTVTPNNLLTISSWAFDKANVTKGVTILDNRAVNIKCYHPGYTFVEKLQTIATKFRQERVTGQVRPNLMRQYYDVYCLLGYADVQEFIGTAEYQSHKEARFPKPDLAIPVSENEAFILATPELREQFRKRYKETSSLYYSGQPEFDVLLHRIEEFIDRL